MMDMANVEHSNAKSLSFVEQAGGQRARNKNFTEVKERRHKKDSRWSEEEAQKEGQSRCWQMPGIDGQGRSVRQRKRESEKAED